MCQGPKVCENRSDCWVWNVMLMRLWRPEFELAGAGCGGWCHCLCWVTQGDCQARGLGRGMPWITVVGGSRWGIIGGWDG